MKNFYCLLITIRFFIPISVIANSDESNNPIKQIKNSFTYKNFLKSRDRYRPPADLFSKGPSSEEEEIVQEKNCLEWFDRNDKLELRKIILLNLGKNLFFSVGTLSLIVTILLKFFIKIKEDRGEADSISLATYFLEAILGTYERFFGSSIKKTTSIVKEEILVSNERTDFENKYMREITLSVSFFYLLFYFKGYFFWVFEKLILSYDLICLIYEPRNYFNLEPAEVSYIKSLYLFSEEQRRKIEDLLISAHSKKNTNWDNIEYILKVQRAIPNGVSKFNYNQELIDKYFEHSPKLKKLAERVLATILIYTKALENDNKGIFDKVAIKSVFLKGRFGTGKSYFFDKFIDMINTKPLILEISPTTEENKDLSVLYTESLIKSSDERGRNYLNGITFVRFIEKNSLRPENGYFLSNNILDPGVKFILEPFLFSKIPKMPISIVSGEVEIVNLKLRDRLLLYELEGFDSENKKGLMDKSIAPAWGDLMESLFELEPEFQKKLTDELYSYISKNSEEVSIRGCEFRAWEYSMDELIKKIKKSR